MKKVKEFNELINSLEKMEIDLFLSERRSEQWKSFGRFDIAKENHRMCCEICVKILQTLGELRKLTNKSFILDTIYLIKRNGMTIRETEDSINQLLFIHAYEVDPV